MARRAQKPHAVVSAACTGTFAMLASISHIAGMGIPRKDMNAQAFHIGYVHLANIKETRRRMPGKPKSIGGSGSTDGSRRATYESKRASLAKDAPSKQTAKKEPAGSRAGGAPLHPAKQAGKKRPKIPESMTMKEFVLSQGQAAVYVSDDKTEIITEYPDGRIVAEARTPQAIAASRRPFTRLTGNYTFKDLLQMIEDIAPKPTDEVVFPEHKRRVRVIREATKT